MSYTKFVISIRSNIAPAKVVDRLTDEELSSLIFMVKSDDPRESEIVANTIANISNCFINKFPKSEIPGTNCRIRNYNDWSNDIYNPEYSHYVYAYATPSKYKDWVYSEESYKLDLKNHQVFYIGRGKTANRNYDHIKDSINNLVNHQPINPEIGKINKIQAFLKKECEEIGKKLVRKVIEINGNYADAQHAAAEFFLINNWIGVYKLENKTRGDTSIGGSTCQWISIPIMSQLKIDDRRTLIDDFTNTNKDTRRVQLSLVISELNNLFKQFPPLNLMNNLAGISTNQIDPLKAVIYNNDAVYSFFLKNKQNKDLVKLQLKLSEKQTGVCFNVRKLENDTLQIFTKKIADIFFNGSIEEAHLKIKNPKDPYFKPLSNNGKDIFFDFLSPELLAYDISDTTLFSNHKILSQQSLISALKIISDLSINVE